MKNDVDEAPSADSARSSAIEGLPPNGTANVLSSGTPEGQNEMKPMSVEKKLNNTSLILAVCSVILIAIASLAVIASIKSSPQYGGWSLFLFMPVAGLTIIANIVGLCIVRRQKHKIASVVVNVILLIAGLDMYMIFSGQQGFFVQFILMLSK